VDIQLWAPVGHGPEPYLSTCNAMPHPTTLAAAAAASRRMSSTRAEADRAAQAAKIAETEDDLGLLPPALKGIALGFLGGVIALVALTLLATQASQRDDRSGSTLTPSSSRTSGKVTASPVQVRR